MRVPEGIPVLSEALDDHRQETRVAAVRGLGRIGSPQAAVPILERLLRGQLIIPAPVLQNALIHCYRTSVRQAGLGQDGARGLHHALSCPAQRLLIQDFCQQVCHT
jgi:hypothetical protein